MNSSEDTQIPRAGRKPPTRRECPSHRTNVYRDRPRLIRGWSVIDAQMIALVVAGLAGLGVLVWLLAKLGKALTGKQSRGRANGTTGSA